MLVVVAGIETENVTETAVVEGMVAATMVATGTEAEIGTAVDAAMVAVDDSCEMMMLGCVHNHESSMLIYGRTWTKSSA